MKNSKYQIRWIDLALVALAVAIGLHTYLSFQYYDLKFGMTTSESICNISETFNCDVVSASAYSSFLGVPMALWGAVTNAVLFLFLFMLRLNLSSEPAKLLRYSYWLSLFVAATSIVMAVISFTLVSALCLFCIAAYLLSFITFGAILAAKDSEAVAHFGEDIKDLTSSYRWVGIFLLAIPAGAFLFHNMIQDSRGADRVQTVIADSLAVWSRGKSHNFTSVGALTRGASNPKMTIVEFADFRCPHCKTASPTLKAFASAHKEEVQLMFKPFPLDGTCNPSPNMQGGDGVSCRLAKAALCGEEVANKGWAVHDWIFEHQSEWTSLSSVDPLLQNLSTELGLEWEGFKACIEKSETTEKVTAAAQEGLDAEIRGTPTVFVNGRKLPGGQMLPVLRATYQSL